MLKPLEVLGVADLPGVEPLLVANLPGLDLLDVLVRLALLAGEVVELDLEVAEATFELVAEPALLGQLRALDGVARLVAQQVVAAVQLLDVEQLELCERVGLHAHFPGRSASMLGRGSTRKVHGSVTRLLTRVSTV